MGGVGGEGFHTYDMALGRGRLDVRMAAGRGGATLRIPGALELGHQWMTN
jgi:hypothetical protein